MSIQGPQKRSNKCKLYFRKAQLKFIAMYQDICPIGNKKRFIVWLDFRTLKKLVCLYICRFFRIFFFGQRLAIRVFPVWIFSEFERTSTDSSACSNDFANFAEFQLMFCSIQRKLHYATINVTNISVSKSRAKCLDRDFSILSVPPPPFSW